MKRWLIILLTVPFLICATTSSTTKVKFHQGSLSSAKEQAAKEGKLYFVEFMASWCAPCRWMDETTFSDQKLADYIDKNYIAVKVDIDDFDGFALKEVFKIKMLPSILVFDASGNLLKQYEESMAPSKMLSILQLHREQSSSAADRQKSNSASVSTNVVTTPEPYGDESATAGSNNKKVAHSPIKNISRPEAPQSKANKAVVAQSAAKKTNTSATAPAEGQGLFRFTVTRQLSRGFSVQIGAFGDYANVLREAAKLEKSFKQPVIVHISSLNGNTVYKLMVGEFDDHASAMDFVNVMKQKNMQAIVKDLSLIQ